MPACPVSTYRQTLWMNDECGANAMRRPAQVLPSPAPSDEPSPAVSNALDSPNPRANSLPDMPSTAQVDAPPSLPVTEARFVHDDTMPPAPRQDFLNFAGRTSAGRTIPVGGPSAPDAPFPQTPVNPMTPSPVTANFPPNVYSAGPVTRPSQQPQPLQQDQQLAVGASVTFNGIESPTMASPTIQDQNGGPPSKRRRTENPAQGVFTLSYSQFIPKLDAWAQSCGGSEAMNPEIEGPRLQLVREACACEDGIFVALHQLFCIWSSNRQEAISYLCLQPEVANNAFSIIEQVLKKNENMVEMHWSWFRDFPANLQDLVQQTNYPTVIRGAAVFLQQLSKNYLPLTGQAYARRYPYLVEELLVHLSCHSPCLQKILFTASRRSLGVTDGHFGAQLDQAFRKDQRRNRDDHTGLFRIPLSSSDFSEQEAGIKSRNALLIQWYQKVVTQATTRPVPAPSPTASTSHSPSLLASPQFASQFAPQISASPIPSPHSMLSNGARRSSYPVPPLGASMAAQQSPVMAQAGFAGPAQHLSGPMQPNMFANLSGVPPCQDLPAMLGAAGHPPLPILRPIPGQGGIGHAQLQYQMVQHLPPHANVSGPQARSQFRNAYQSMGQTRISNQPQISPQQTVSYQTIPGQVQYQPQQIWAGTNGVIPPQPFPRVAVIPSTPAISQPGTSALPSALLTPGSSLMPTLVNNPNTSALGSPAAMTPELFGRNLTGAYTRHKVAQAAADPLFPRKGHAIPRPEWPFDHSEQKSILMALHQADVRSPKRVMRGAGASDVQPERHYQYPRALPVGPVSVPFADRLRKFTFHVTQEQFACISTSVRHDNQLLSVIEHFNGSLRWRVRCCKLPKLEPSPSPEAWATTETYWPMNIFMSLNNSALSIRRHSHNGKDLATELTRFIVAGENVLQVSIPTSPREGQGHYFLAVEEIVTARHSSIVDQIMKEAVIPEATTLQEIKKRLASTGGSDDGDLIFEATDLSVDLADPFSATVFQVPARGTSCTHIECFDLETWLNTRPTKSVRKCHHTVQCDCPKTEEPSSPDKWKCPICSKDARPCSLRVDSFLLGVRRKLEQDQKLHAKRMTVAADGTWNAVVEADTEDDSDDDDEPRTKRSRQSASTGPSAKNTTAPVEVIILDDD
ncbi:hypothetical protein GQ53DRAFT_118216 [Thozetella sp. PMI_491]|nr:hypothetical protein GQ53DRAFT_118216 [Thozetella sp. PMI_491]